MANPVRLVKLRYEVPVDSVTRFQARLLYKTLCLQVIRNIESFKRLSHRPYPISYSSLLRMCKLIKSGAYYFIGIWPNSLRGKDKDSYLKVLDVEYGVNGIEQRIMRRSLEECFIRMDRR